jgi:hypothetical protein
LQEVDEEQGVIKYLLSNEKNEVHEMFLAKKTERFFSVLIEKHLWQDEIKFRTFFILSWDKFKYVLTVTVCFEIFTKLHVFGSRGLYVLTALRVVI